MIVVVTPPQELDGIDVVIAALRLLELAAKEVLVGVTEVLDCAAATCNIISIFQSEIQFEDTNFINHDVCPSLSSPFCRSLLHPTTELGWISRTWCITVSSRSHSSSILGI
jgi:hypothetical protein